MSGVLYREGSPPTIEFLLFAKKISLAPYFVEGAAPPPPSILGGKNFSGEKKPPPPRGVF